MVGVNDNRAGSSPLVSVVIPAFRAEEFIEETIASIHRQDHRPIEVVVVEDCSPDGTAQRVEALASELEDDLFRIILLRQPVNMGGAAALARGFGHASGDYLCWLSADDAFVGTSKLTEQVAQLRESPGVSYARSFYRGPSAADLGQDELYTAMWWPERPVMESIMVRFPSARLVGLLFRVPINGSTIMIDRRTWEQLGNFDPVLGNIDQDSDMWMRYSALGARISAISTLAGFYRIHPGQTSNLTEDCVIGASATRIRVIMAYERAGRLSGLLSRTWVVLALAHRWSWDRARPIVADYLCRSGLSVSHNPLVRSSLSKMQRRLQMENLVDERLAAVARERAELSFDSPEFRSFRSKLETHLSSD